MTIDELRAAKLEKYLGTDIHDMTGAQQKWLELAPLFLDLFDAAYDSTPGDFASAVICGKERIYKALSEIERTMVDA